ncbi:MAG: plastocyanin/azurin family copper-binding protein [Gemmatimonadales bacterium]
MRASFLMAGLVLALVACGGSEDATPADTAAMTDTGMVAETAEAPATTGTTHNVNMSLEGSDYVYSPATLTVKPGDVVVFHNVSGGPHNVEFYPDSIPAGAADALNAGMPNRMGPLQGPLLIEPNATYEVSFAGAPVGEYKFFCLPHVAMGMKGSITVE